MEEIVKSMVYLASQITQSRASPKLGEYRK